MISEGPPNFYFNDKEPEVQFIEKGKQKVIDVQNENVGKKMQDALNQIWKRRDTDPYIFLRKLILSCVVPI